MKKPFDGLFGDTCESRILQFLLPMYGIEFDMAELKDEVQLTRQSISKVMKKFSILGIVKSRKVGRNRVYSINEESALVKRIEDLDNALIESMLGDEFEKMHEAYTKHVGVSPQKANKQVSGTVLLRQDVSGGPIQIDFQNLGWSDEIRQKNNLLMPQLPSQNEAYPPICAGSGA